MSASGAYTSSNQGSEAAGVDEPRRPQGHKAAKAKQKGKEKRQVAGQSTR